MSYKLSEVISDGVLQGLSAIWKHEAVVVPGGSVCVWQRLFSNVVHLAVVMKARLQVAFSRSMSKPGLG